MSLKMHKGKDKRKLEDKGEDSSGTRTSSPLVSDETPVPKQRKRPWRYNKVWRRDQKWTREGLTTKVQQRAPPLQSTVPGDQPTQVLTVTVPKQKLDDPAKDLPGTCRTSQVRASEEAVPKKTRRPWRYNRVWRRDQKWTKEVDIIPEQTQPQRVQPPTPVQKEQPTKPVPVRVPKQPEPPKFLRRYWRTNRVWKRDMVWTRKDHKSVPSTQEVAVSSSTAETRSNPCPNHDGQEAVTDASSPAAENRLALAPHSNEQKAVSDRIIDVERRETKVAGDKEEGGTSGESSELHQIDDPCFPLTDIQTGAKDQSTRKRKRPDQPFVPSKRPKTALFSPMEIEVQSLVQMFDAMTL